MTLKVALVYQVCVASSVVDRKVSVLVALSTSVDSSVECQ